MNEPVKFLSDFKSDFEISVVKKKLKHEVASPAILAVHLNIP